MRSPARTTAAALNVPFDWDAYNAEFDARMAGLAAALNAYNAAEAAISRASIECARDLQAILGEQFK
jgi:hypothetical protein